jgi:protein-S-isoprenylcysteine O-methyltransferase Ste14
MNQLEKFPPVKWAMRHPRLAAWIVLALGMVILLVIEAREVGLLPTQWIALIVATVLVAGACVWIISWEDPDEEPEATPEKPKADAETPQA